MVNIALGLIAIVLAVPVAVVVAMFFARFE